MNIYHVSQKYNNGYDTFSDFVVVAPDAKTAKRTFPDDDYGLKWVDGKGWQYDSGSEHSTWSWVNDLKYVKVKLIGKAESKKAGVVCSSFHAG